jgi:branched-chain amino acid transport system substrate-binding protein
MTPFIARWGSAPGPAWLACAALLSALTGCSSSSSDQPDKPEFDVGMLVEQDSLTYTQQELGAVVMAMRQINDDGGLTIDGVDYLLSVKAEDHQSSPAGAVAAMKRLSDGGVTATIGPPWSWLALGDEADHSDGVSLNARAYDMLLVSSSATAPAITELEDDDLQWRTIPSDIVEADVAAQELLSRDLTRVALLFRGEAWGHGLADAFTTAFEAGGGQVLAAVDYDVSGERVADLSTYDFDSELATVFADQPQVVLVYSFDELSQITNRIAANDYLSAYTDAPPRFFGTEGSVTSQLLVNGAPEVIQYMEGVSPTPDTEDAYYREFKGWMTAAELNIADNTAAARYDAVFCLAAAAQKANSRRADDIKRELQAISRKDGDELTVHAGEWAKAKAALLAGDDIDYDGVSGRIEFSDRGDPTTGLYSIWRLALGKGGKFVIEPTKTVPYGG